MSSQLTFDEDQARAIEALYMSESVLARRRRALEIVELRAVDVFLDLGCGPGFLTAEATGIVGDSGAVHALDSSDNMLVMARARTVKGATASEVKFHQGDALELPFPDGYFDAIAVLQVYEYVSDIDTALAELHRVLKPDGRYVIIDTDWGSMVFHSVTPALTSRILRIFEGHLADPRLPRTLGPRLRANALSLSHIEPFIQMSPGNADVYVKALTELISDYVRDKDGLTDADLDGWKQGLNRLESSNESFMSLSQFFFSGHKT